jgi:hypothetical protein
MVGTDQIGMPAIGGLRNKRPGLYGFEPIRGKALADLIGAHQYVLMTKCSNYPSGAITALILLKNGNHLMFHYTVFRFDLIGLFIVPFVETTSADSQYFTYLIKGVQIADGINKSINNC